MKMQGYLYNWTLYFTWQVVILLKIKLTKIMKAVINS